MENLTQLKETFEGIFGEVSRDDITARMLDVVLSEGAVLMDWSEHECSDGIGDAPASRPTTTRFARLRIEVGAQLRPIARPKEERKMTGKIQSAANALYKNIKKNSRYE